MGKRKVEVEEKPVAPSTSNDANYDSSDEEDLRNTIGNVPVEWYEDVDHIGYDLYGQKIAKQPGGKKDEIDAFLSKIEDPDYWRSVFDRQTGADTKLTDEQIDKIKAISIHRYPQVGYNPYTEFLDIYSSRTEIHPISNRPPDKRSFVPSADERRLVGRMVHAIKMGWTKQKQQEEQPRVYDLWASESDDAKSKSELARLKMHWPAPKAALPTHAESYNPPSEYLFDENEKKKWEETEPEKRRLNFAPQKYDALRKVPAYDKFYNERFERCLDLYLAPRQRKMKLDIDPSQLLPELPNPTDLQPFPTTLAFYMRGHDGQVRTISIEPEKGELLASGGEDSNVRIWYLPSGRCLRTFQMSASVTCVAYCPDMQKTLVLVACESNIVSILNSDCGDKLQVSSTKNYINELEFNDSNQINWKRTQNGRIEIELKDKIRQVIWHKKGDYFATVSFEASADTVHIHQLSKCSSQKPFTKKKGSIQCVLFHPTQPLFFVATLQHVRVYDLAKCQLKKKIITGSRWVSCMHLDNFGNNLFIGGLDKIFSWVDLELSTKPWKSLKNHSAAVRSLTYHRRYPLLATASDDGTAIVYHARIPQDLMKENELIPVKRLFGHGSNQKKKKSDDKAPLTILNVIFHPTQPWLLTAGADGQIGLFTY